MLIIKTIKICIAAFTISFLYASENMLIFHAENQKPTINMTIPAIDFDESMQVVNYKNMLENPVMQKIYTAFRKQYTKFHPSDTKPELKTHIPKKLHQIWLGGNGNLPEEYQKFQKSWQNFHPDWKYKLWTEKDVSTFSFENKDLFDTAKNYGEKSDIWRYEILFKEGGLYIDTDFECLAPFDVFHYTYDFYIGIQPMDTNLIQLGIGLIGACPGHPLLKLAIKNLRTERYNKQIISRTGPIFFTRIFYNNAHTTELRDIAFPSSYFYPCGYNQRSILINYWLKPESFAVHHWAGSWLKKEAFEK